MHKHKDKKSSGCGLCKPHKHGGRAMKDKERLGLEAENKELGGTALLDKKYVEGYRKYPEDPNEIHPLFMAGLESFSKDDWNDVYPKVKKFK